MVEQLSSGVCNEKGRISCGGKELVQTRFAQTDASDCLWCCHVFDDVFDITCHASHGGLHN